MLMYLNLIFVYMRNTFHSFENYRLIQVKFVSSILIFVNRFRKEFSYKVANFLMFPVKKNLIMLSDT
jgi:hypothetical protein